MRYTLLGNSGLRASELALGTMTFGTDWGWGASESESAKQFELFAEAGGILIDIGGFLLIEAESAEAAVQIAEQAPHIALGGSVIVRPCLEVPRPAGSPH